VILANGRENSACYPAHTTDVVPRNVSSLLLFAVLGPLTMIPA
jgi:hypothetical protein